MKLANTENSSIWKCDTVYGVYIKSFDGQIYKRFYLNFDKTGCVILYLN